MRLNFVYQSDGNGTGESFRMVIDSFSNRTNVDVDIMVTARELKIYRESRFLLKFSGGLSLGPVE